MAVNMDKGIEGIGNLVRPLNSSEASQLPVNVLCRIVRGDARGRPFGSPRNPSLPTIEDFNPRVGELKAGDIAGAIRGRRHGINPDQAAAIRKLSDDELLRFRIDDPISGCIVEGGFDITGGHHRLAEITGRVETGELSADALVRIVFHD